ncbi:phospholipase D family protein [Aminobacter anthyllidis]|uniref:Phospholipase D n=1 Tax=Aminobacter anthyllidis TaxID=1035067 RepID=A0A9X1D415_9HYPH|nr:phospholipase D family protein [Aminobacter anthyllidis]MBT1155687.1 phospholipase D family protein [Aminobacter anthyllidis]
MKLIAIAVAIVGILVIASLLAVYAYGRFAKRAQGMPSSALPTAEGETQFDRLVAPLLANHLDHSGLALLSSNLHAFAIRAYTARHAQRSLDLQYYYWKDDLTGSLLAREILAAADRGVRVRLILDDINAKGYDPNYLALDSHPNIEVRLFNPSWARAFGLQRGLELVLRAVRTTRRMHNKAWVADGRLAIVGGRNVGDAYFDASEDANFRDMDLLLVGPVVGQTEAIFDRFWNSEAVLPIRHVTGMARGDLPALRTRLERTATTGLAEPYIHRVAEESREWSSSGMGKLRWTSEATVASDPPEKASGAGQDTWLMKAIRPILTSAKRELRIVSPYFIPGENGTRELTALARSGVEVTVLTNSLAATDVAAVHGAYVRYRKPLLENGIDIYELKPDEDRTDMSLFGSKGASLHTKAFIADGEAGFVGSFNFDPRSAALNTEMGVLFRQAELASEVEAVISAQTSPRSAFRLSLHGGRLTWTDSAANGPRELKHEPQASLRRRLLAKIISYLPIESQL